MINRTVYQQITNKLFKGKIIILLGARQTGKSTILRTLEQEFIGKKLFLDCDDPYVRNLLTNQPTNNLLRIVGNNEIVFIDEAQRVENIGLTLKQIHDNKPECQLVVSGSSSLELANKVNEPLTGRKFEFLLFPLSFDEMQKHTSLFEEQKNLEQRLLFGYYPDVVVNKGYEIENLKSLTNSYLYKDIFIFQDIRKPQIIEKLLQNLALQLASEVSFNELATSLQVNIATIEKYIDLLEKSFIIFRLNSFSRNVRNELKKSKKIYFYDNGVRNAIINNFNSLNLRSDAGQLWENFLVSERYKLLVYNNLYCNRYFWRTTQQQEIDYIEEHSGKIFAFEFKWNVKQRKNIPKTFQKAYPQSEFKIINSENFFDFVTYFR